MAGWDGSRLLRVRKSYRSPGAREASCTRAEVAGPKRVGFEPFGTNPKTLYKSSGPSRQLSEDFDTLAICI